MPGRKITKTKLTKAVKKTSKPRSKKSSHLTKHEEAKESAILLSTDFSNNSMAHGHASYYHNPTHQSVKKLDDRSQRLIMYIGISLIMVVIVFFWIMNLKSILGPEASSVTASEADNNQTKTDFEALKNDLTKTLDEVKGEIKNLEALSGEIVTPSAKPDLITETATPNLITGTATPSLPATLPN